MATPTEPHPFSLSQVTASPSFRNLAVNAVAVVPLLAGNEREATTTSKSCKSFAELFEALKRHTTTEQKPSRQNDRIIVVPNSRLSRPGDWRYEDTPLKSFHWQHGCQRLHVFDGRPEHSRVAHERLHNASVTQDWVDISPSRRTAAVIGVLNMHDCNDEQDLIQAEMELHQWADRFSTAPYQATAHGKQFDSDKPVVRLFVYDSFDEECQKVDISKTSLGNKMSPFPPAPDPTSPMIDLHLNVVINDLTVAILLQLEEKVKECDARIVKAKPSKRTTSRATSGDKETDDAQDGPLGVGNIANLVGPESKLAATSEESPQIVAPKTPSPKPIAPTDSASSKTSTSSSVEPWVDDSVALLMTPVDSSLNPAEMSGKLSDAIRKRDIGRREKYAADFALLAGSPLDAYGRYLKAAEHCRSTTPDPLWYAFALVGCAAAHIAMAEGGGFSVDEYLENNFQLPDDIMALGKKDPKQEKSTSSTKQTLPEIVLALCDEALNITNRNPLVAGLHAELLVTLALYCAEESEVHLRCRWGDSDGCFAGEVGDPRRWTKTTVSRMAFDALTASDLEVIDAHAFTMTKKTCELLQEAVSVGALDAVTRIDVALRSARLCLSGLQVSPGTIIGCRA